MRITHVTDCYLPRLGGIEIQVHDLAQRQRADGHDVTVVTSVAGTDDADAPPGVRVVRPPRRSRRGDPAAIRYRRAVRGRAAVFATEPDLVHVHASAFSPLAFLTTHAAARRGIPAAVTLHSLWAYATPLFAAADGLTGWGDWPVAWSAVSEAAAAPLRRVLDRRAAVAVLPNGVEPEQWRVEPVPPDGDELRLVSVMRLAPRKRPRHLLQVLRDVRRRLPAAHRLTVDIVGDGPERPALERYLRAHEMTDWVRLAGRLSREDIRSVYARADAFLAPATLESFGIAALEARCAGLPVVARTGTGIQDFVHDGQEGLLCGSDAEMAAAVVRLATDPSLRARLAAHNRTVPPQVTWDLVQDRCDALYRTARALAGRSAEARRPPRRPVAGLGR